MLGSEVLVLSVAYGIVSRRGHGYGGVLDGQRIAVGVEPVGGLTVNITG